MIVPTPIKFIGYAGKVNPGQVKKNLERLKNLTVMNLPLDTSRALAKLAQRNMQLQCRIQEGQIWVADKDNTVEIELTPVKTSSDAMR